jgi:hypothetical protein
MAKTAGNQGIFLKNLLNIEKKEVRVKKTWALAGLKRAGISGYTAFYPPPFGSNNPHESRTIGGLDDSGRVVLFRFHLPRSGASIR